MKYLLALSLCLLSSCYATRISLEDPMGLPFSQPVLNLKVHSEQTELAQQLQSDLLRLLPRERHVQAVLCAADCPTESWQLQIELLKKQAEISSPLTILGPPPGPARLRTELTLEAELWAPLSKTPQHFSWSQRGEALPGAQARLEQQLLRLLQQQLIQALQPRYVESSSL